MLRILSLLSILLAASCDGCGGTAAEGEGEGSAGEGEGEGEGEGGEGEGSGGEGEGEGAGGEGEGEGAGGEGEGEGSGGEGEGEGGGPGCGDGVVAGAEQCDDGAVAGGDGCGVDCRIEPGFFCDNPLSAPSVCGPFSVDLGNLAIGGSVVEDDTTPNPQVRHYLIHVTARAVLSGSGFSAPGATSITILDDTGRTLADARSGSFSDIVVDPQTIVVSVVAIAGNTTQVTHTTFTVSARAEAVCTDGVVVSPETCDDANPIDGDGCSACAIDAFFTCAGAPSVCAPVWIEAGSLAPAGTLAFHDGAALSSGAARFYRIVVTADLDADIAVTASGGGAALSMFARNGNELASTVGPDGVLHAHLPAGDAILGVQALGDLASVDIAARAEVCGDGALDFFEGCDDGSATGGDGCAQCRAELFFTCTRASPSVCSAPVDIGHVAPGATLTHDVAVVPDDGTASLDDYAAFTLDAAAVMHISVSSTTGVAGFTLLNPAGAVFIDVVAPSGDVGLLAGAYVIAVSAHGDLANVHVALQAAPLEADLGAVGQNAALGPIHHGNTGPGALVVYALTFTSALTADAAVALASGTATCTLHDVDGNVVGDPFESAAPAFSAAVPAGSYLLEVRAGPFATVNAFDVTVTTAP